MTTGLFEVEVKNRVVKGALNTRRIKGAQGNWYQERLYFLAESEEEAKDFTFKELRLRRCIGISGSRRKKSNIRREIEVIEIRRVI